MRGDVAGDVLEHAPMKRVHGDDGGHARVPRLRSDGTDRRRGLLDTGQEHAAIRVFHHALAFGLRVDEDGELSLGAGHDREGPRRAKTSEDFP